MLVLLFALPASAQQGSGIAGTARDDSGAVMPGVTVEASSPALIEKVRSAVTDGSGQYRIVNLVPGTYTVTFTLPGFSTLKRDGVELTTNFTATVNAELKVGSLEESITVSGSAPLVDVQSAAVSQQVTRETLDAIPTGRSVQAVGKILPGITTSGGERGGVDVGGTAGFQSVTLNSHGSRGDNVYQIDGMTVQSGIGNGTSPQYYNEGQFEEYTYTSSGIPAEVAYGGVRIQMTSKEGGNAFHGQGLAQIEPWQSNNFTDELRDAGLRVPDAVLKLWDTSFSLGGPFIKDRLWFFTTHRYNGGDFLVGNSFYRDQAVCDQYGSKKEKANNCQGVDDNYELSNIGRLTYQATTKHKIAGFYSKENKQRGHRELAAGVSPEASTPQNMRLSYSSAIKWTAPLTSKLLWDAGVSQYYLGYTFEYQDGAQFYDNLAYQDTGTQHALGRASRRSVPPQQLEALSLGHAGVRHRLARDQGRRAVPTMRPSTWYYNVDPWHMVAVLRNGVPTSVTVDNTTVNNRPGHDESAFFIQDQWTLKRLTINPGVRYDWFHPWVGAQEALANPWVPARQFNAIDDMLAFKNWAPRFSAIYDVFGNGKTAVKANISKYVAILGNSQADLYNPLAVLTDSRTWRDTNGDLFPQYSEVGPSTISNFGTRAPRLQDPNVEREKQVEWSASLQHQLTSRVALTAGYYHRTFYDLNQTVNTLVNVETDYTPVQIADPRGNGQSITIYNLNPAKLGVTNFVDSTSKKNRLYWDGIDLSAQGTVVTGGRVYGGVSFGGRSQDMCDIVDPNFTGSLGNPVWGKQVPASRTRRGVRC
ncbi:MAG: carboxypeptidase regulatory-like domain-containing protein [Vicinamibacterales bacterium]